MIADALGRSSPTVAEALAPAAGVGVLFLVAALVRGGVFLGPALGLGGATYIGAVVAAGHRVDPTAPLVAVLLLLSGELAAWSFDSRLRIDADDILTWRRGAAIGALALLGLGAATLAVVLSAVPPGHGLAWTAVGAASAVAAIGAAVGLTRRQ